MTLRQTEELLKRCLELTEQRGGTSPALTIRDFAAKWEQIHGPASGLPYSFAEAYASSRLAEVTAQRKLSDWTEIEGDDDKTGAKLGKFLVWLCNLTEDGPRYLELATYLLITHRNAWADTELERLTSDKKVLQALIEDYQKAVDGSGRHHLIAPENVKARFDEVNAENATLRAETDALFEFVKKIDDGKLAWNDIRIRAERLRAEYAKSHV